MKNQPESPPKGTNGKNGNNTKRPIRPSFADNSKLILVVFGAEFGGVLRFLNLNVGRN